MLNPRERNASTVTRAASRSPTVPARRSSPAPTIARVVATASAPPNTTSPGRPWGSGLGRLSSENITSTTASRAGTKAAL